VIRAAAPDDLPALIEMGRAFNEEAGYAESVPFDPDSFHLSLVLLGKAERLLVGEMEGRVVSMAAVGVLPALVNHNVACAREAFWYVLPEYRRGIGKKLLAALECTAKNQGATFFDGVAEEGARSTALARIYTGRDYNLIERIFRKRL